MKAVSHFVDAPNLNDETYDFCEQRFYYVPPAAVTDSGQNEIDTGGSVVNWLKLKGYKETNSCSDFFSGLINQIKVFM